METRIYVVTKHNSDAVRFVEASNQAQVGRHLAADYAIRVATSKDLARWRDVRVEQINGRPDPND